MCSATAASTASPRHGVIRHWMYNVRRGLRAAPSPPLAGPRKGEGRTRLRVEGPDLSPADKGGQPLSGCLPGLLEGAVHDELSPPATDLPGGAAARARRLRRRGDPGARDLLSR